MKKTKKAKRSKKNDPVVIPRIEIGSVPVMTEEQRKEYLKDWAGSAKTKLKVIILDPEGILELCDEHEMSPSQTLNYVLMKAFEAYEQKESLERWKKVIPRDSMTQPL